MATLPTPQPPSSVPGNNRKRPLENDAALHNSKPFKLRALLKDLRPHFLEVLRTSDFRNCKAANEIQEQMKLLVELYKQMMSETKPSSGENNDGQNQQEKLQTDNKFQPSTTSEKLQDGEITGTYVVGGSAFGWNFITFSSKEPVYYGVSKESFRTAKATPP